MAVTQTTITGPVYLPNVTKPEEAKIVFELSSWDREDGEAVFVSGPYIAALDAGGNFTVNLFTSTVGENQVVYNVSVIYLTLSGEYRIERLGTIALAGLGPYALADLDFIDPLTSGSFDLLAEARAYNTYFNSVITDLGTLASAISSAETSKTKSENWAIKTDGLVEDTDYSSKAWAIGGTGVTDTASRGSAKDWATKAEDSTVDGTGYSALHHAAKSSADRVLAQTARIAAETAATNAETAETGALAAQTAAETARDGTLSAAASQGYFATAAAGVDTVSGVADGETYWTLDGDEIVYYENDGGTATAIPGARLDTTAVTATIKSRTVAPVEVLGTGSDVLNASYYFWPATESDIDQWVYSITTGKSAISDVNILVCTVEGDGSLTLVSGRTENIAAGVVTTVFPEGIYVPAGAIVGFQTTSSALFTSGTIPDGGVQWSTTTKPSTSTAKTSGTTNGVHWSVALRNEIAHKARSGFDRISGIENVVGATHEIGWPDLVSTGTDTPANYSIIIATPIVADGRLTEVQVGADGPGTSTIYVVSMSGNTATVVSTTDVTLADGVNVIALDIPVSAGQYVGIGGGGYKFQNSTNVERIVAWFKSGVIASDDAMTLSTQHGFEVRFEYKTGQTGDIFKLENRSAGNSGLALLDEADATGSEDATSILTAARADHPNPYIPPGVFAVTALPQAGNGLWGAGRLALNGKDFLVARQPRQGSLYQAFRQRFAEQIGTGAPLILWGDSITQWATAPNAAAHFSNRLAAFANILTSPGDEPVLVNFTSLDTFTPAFYGVTVAGTTTGGSRGPIGNTSAGSIVLSAGASLTFTGTYATLGLTYIREPSAGTLTVERGATTLATIDADGVLELDRYSGEIATSVTESATYTITASVADVEITSLMRFGVSSDANVKRLPVIRWARGSFGFGNFAADEITSILKISAALSASPPAVLCFLGINDAASISTASAMKSVADAKIDLLQAGGVEGIIGLLPMRPSSATHLSRYENYDAVLAGLRQSYRTQGAQTISVPVDMVAAGLFGDGIHPTTDEGQRVIVQSILEGLAP